MKKLLSCILLLSLVLVSVMAETNSASNYEYIYNSSFSDLMDSINVNEPYETIKNVFAKSLDMVGNDIILRIRIKLAYLDYLNAQNNKSYKTEIKNLLNTCYEDLDKLDESKVSKAIKDSITFLLYGIDYRVTGSISKGTASIKLIDNCYKDNSNDESIMLLYAQRKAEAPSIGGGDTKLATKILLQLLNNLSGKTKAFQYAVYSELSYVYQKTDKTKSESYRQKAEDLYNLI